MPDDPASATIAECVKQIYETLGMRSQAAAQAVPQMPPQPMPQQPAPEPALMPQQMPGAYGLLS